MKLISIMLCNFRQFYGESIKLILASSATNTTVIHGNNGSGKTTLMNAFTWVLYEKFSPAFTSPEQLVNKRSLAEAEVNKPVPCWVEIIFEHDHKRYQAQRICRAYKNDTGMIEYGKSELYMKVVSDDGRWIHPEQSGEQIINRILPESLHQYFFFDGEKIEKIVRSDQRDEISEATKELLGIEVLNRGIKHLAEAKKSLESELQVIGNAETKELLQNKSKKDGELDKIEERQKEIHQELKNYDQLKQEINNRLLEFKGAEGLPQQRQNLQSQASSLQEQLGQANQSIKNAIATTGYTVLLTDVITDFRGIIDGLRDRGELPTGIKQQFVEELLNRKRCICGTELITGENHYNHVASWMAKAGVADVEETAIRLSVQVEEIAKKIPDFWQEIDDKQNKISGWRKELSLTETQIEDINKKLRNFPNEDIQDLQKRLHDMQTKIDDLNRETGGNEQRISVVNKEIQELNKEINKKEMNEKKQKLAQERISVTQEAVERLTEVKNRLERHFRASLERRVQEIFNQISVTPYVPQLNSKYELSLIENTSGKEASVAASTGENQILSLSFILGIIDSVRQWSQKNTFMGPDSSTFPIVMDSPFGSLDQISRRHIAEKLPQLANQLIILVTQTQWRGEVATEMDKYIGRQYVLVYNSPKPECEESVINIGGIDYPLVRQSPNDFEYTEILEVDENW